MEIIHHTKPLSNDCYTLRYFKDNTAFFDIETTGFSPTKCAVYLIGMAIRRGDSMEIFQFFAGNSQEEGEVLTAFHNAVESVSTLICYNGLHFDLPFLKQREKMQNLPFDWENISLLDLYQETRHFGSLLPLPDKKQKTMERFLGIHREDTFTGGELAKLYRRYEKQPTDSDKSLLLLHNYEDILGMTKLLPLLSYCSFFQEEPHVESASIAKTVPFGADSPTRELQAALRAPLPFPRQVSLEKMDYRLVFRQGLVHLFVPIREGELLFYYDNYKDYYYLPLEDMAIHKSVASFVDKAHREKASRDNCYARRRGMFLPQCGPWFTPCFYPGKAEKNSYFECHESFPSEEEPFIRYVRHILSLFH